jgi:hypothetical protein
MDSYVYKHICPDTGEVVYVGIGTGNRAWTAGKGTGRTHNKNGLRTIEHADWMNGHFNNGVNPIEFVGCNLSRKDARAIESREIDNHQPRFNKMGTDAYRHSKAETTKDEALECRRLRSKGLSYLSINRIMWPGSTGAMRAHRAINQYDLEFLG